MSNDHEFVELAASYALGALDEQERIAFEAHLSACAACRATVRAHEEGVEALAWTAPARQPPAALRERILREASAVRPISAARPDRTDQGSAGAGAPRSAASRAAGRARWLAAASVVLAVAATALLVRERSTRNELQELLLLVQDRATEGQARVAQLATELAARDSLLSAVLAPDIRTVRLTAQGRPPSARIFWSPDLGRVVIAAFDLDPAPAGRTYQLWGIAGGSAPASLGMFNTGADGRAVVSFEIGQAMRFDVAAITEEPAGGSPQPTTTPFLVGGIGL